MSLIKNSLFLKFLVFLFFLLLSIKIFDNAIGYIEGFYNNKNIEIKRSLILREHAPNLNQIVKPSFEYIKDTQNLLMKEFLLRTNQDGFIVGQKDLLVTKDKNNVSIIFFGGSTTECLYVEEEKRFPYLVSEILNDHIMNGGVSGNHSMHSLLSIIGKAIPYRPNHIVLMHAVNDLGLLSKTLSYWDAPNGRSLIQLDNTTIKNTVIYDLARFVKNLLVPNLWLKTHYIFNHTIDSTAKDEWAFYRERKYEYNDINKALNEQFKASLKSFVRLCRAWGIEPILMTQFNRIKKMIHLLGRRMKKNLNQFRMMILFYYIKKQMRL